MEDLIFYAKLGWDHVASRDALDHQLFLLVLSLGYGKKELKSLVYLISAFTLGHCLTLVLSTFKIVSIPSAWVETIIPITIICTSIHSFFVRSQTNKNLVLEYSMAFLFGLIHGLGFANTLQVLLSENQNFIKSLLGFNLGVEAAQLVFIIIWVFIQHIIIKTTTWRSNLWRKAISCIIFIAAICLCIERIELLQ